MVKVAVVVVVVVVVVKKSVILSQYNQTAARSQGPLSIYDDFLT